MYSSSWFAVSLLLASSTAHAKSGYDYKGGVAIRYPNASCPTGTYYEGTSYEANCCPIDTYPAQNGSAYCCPTKTDCSKQVDAYVKCADPGWIYCPSPDNAPLGLCCLNGWTCWAVPLQPTGHGVGCSPPGVPLTSPQAALPTAWGAYEGPGQVTTKTVKDTPTPKPKSTTSSSSSTSSPTGHGSSGGLSTGAEAGIGVGAAVVAIGVIGGAIWFARAWRRTRPADVRPHESNGAALTHELPPDGEVHEASAEPKLHELPDHSRSELEGGWPEAYSRDGVKYGRVGTEELE